MAAAERRWRRWGARGPAAGSWAAASAGRWEAARWGEGWAAAGAGWRWAAAGNAPPPRTSPRPGTWRGRGGSGAKRGASTGRGGGGACGPRRLRGEAHRPPGQ